MCPAEKDIDVKITINFEALELSMPELRKLVKTICIRFGDSENTQTKYEISIAIVGDTEIEELNARFLNHQTTTDCLSFDLSEAEDDLKIFELIVNGEMAIRQAEMLGHSGEAELALYVAHGLLHNLGFDDSTPNLARKMHATEDEILQQLGYGFVYNRNTETPEH
jgi:probable rRNA maturation factor